MKPLQDLQLPEMARIEGGSCFWGPPPPQPIINFRAFWEDFLNLFVRVRF